MRPMFYDALLADYAEVPRTIVLSTHPVSEVSALLEEVVILDSGAAHNTVTGRRAAWARFVDRRSGRCGDEFTDGFTVRSEERLGGTRSTTVLGDLDPTLLAQATAGGLEIGPVGLEDLFVHLTASTGARS
ncbi:MAG TPA: hypothetical protein VIH10_10190 [Kribbella sp.]